MGQYLNSLWSFYIASIKLTTFYILYIYKYILIMKDVGIDNKRTLITSDGVEISNIWKPINLFEVCQMMSELSSDLSIYND